MRGEHSFNKANSAADKGSSPHARGALQPVRAGRHGPGIIPACAGSTWRSLTRGLLSRDHPRMRGEHAMPRSFESILRGSSPHARGARRRYRGRPRRPGIIPACAGSTAAGRPSTPSRWDHPRMRGEHNSRSALPVCHRGSSPHARGARTVCDLVVRNGGIIPACAGSTLTACTCSRSPRDHPRMRGEH